MSFIAAKKRDRAFISFEINPNFYEQSLLRLEGVKAHQKHFSQEQISLF